MKKDKKEKKGKKGKTWLIILLVILGIILIAVAAIVIIANRNLKEINALVDETVAKVSEGRTVTEVDAGDYSDMTAYGILKFHVTQYDIENFGNLSVMTANAGIMQMTTVVLSPFNKDLPLFSCDFMYILASRTAYVEFYDLVAEKDDTYMSWIDRYEELNTKYSALEDTVPTPAWYDSFKTAGVYKTGSTGDDAAIRDLLVDALSVYFEQADAYPLLSDSEKPAKIDRIKAYSDRLIDEGGVSTSFLKQSFGEEMLRDFFDKVFFGTEKYR